MGVSDRTRLKLFAALAVVCVAGGVVAVVAGAGQGDDPALRASAAARKQLAAARAGGRPVVLFRALPGGHPKATAQVELAAAAAGAAAGRRVPAGLSCARLYFAGGHALCVARSRRLLTAYRAEVLGPDLRVQRSLNLSGLPSRARVSPDGRYGAVTMFVAGDSYAAPGTFSTRTSIIDLASGRDVGALEQFTVTDDGRQVTAVDVNFWGVTFARDSDRFYATLATGGKTYLIQGSVSGRTAHVLHENVECPSLSPDGTRIAFKKRTGSRARPWRLTVLDLETMRETPLAERRSVDDQAEWLDDGHILYGLGGSVWMVRADGGGRPVRYLPDADSPAVVGASPG
jgi:WD40-like Beta Propeller Repeat